MTQLFDRRGFLRQAGALAATAAVGRVSGAAAPAARNSVCVFTKPFNSISFDELAARTAEIGFQGIEAPIRAGGHIEPEAVPDRLPALVEALKKHKLEVTVLTSDINDPRAPLSESVLSTAAKLGIRRYRMKYFKYDKGLPVKQQLREWKAQMKDLAALNREIGIRGVYQNHAGNGTFGAVLWDLQQVLDGISPEEIGVAFDIRHATVESGMSWPTTFRMIRPHVDTVYVKDFRWDGARPKNVPLGEGRVSPTFFKQLRDSGFTGPISLHEEYLDHRKPELVPQHWEAIRKDYQVLTSWLEGATPQ